MPTNQTIIPFDCDGLPEKPELPPGYDASKTPEFLAEMAIEVPEMLGLFEQIIELAKQRGDIPKA